jgi:Major Facilitator Superfamily
MEIGAGPDASPPGPRLREPWRPGPLAGRYPAAAAMVILFLVPYLGLSAALPPVTPLIAAQLRMSAQTVSLTSGMANAGYAVGTVLAVQFAQLLPQRRMLLIYGALLVAGSVLAATAAGPAMFIAWHVLQGLCTSLLLVAAAPPLLLGYPATRLRWSAVILNMCLFGAVTAGPLIGGAQASFHAWRALFWIVAAAGMLMSLLTFQDAPPADRGAPRHGLAIGLAAAGSVAAFWGAAELTTHRFLTPVAVGPAAGRAGTDHRLVGVPVPRLQSAADAAQPGQHHPDGRDRGGDLRGGRIDLRARADRGRSRPHHAPLHLGLLFIPELGGAMLTSIVLGAVFSTRGIHYFVLAGMGFLIAGILVLRSAVSPTAALTLAGSGLVGVGIGASVTPALFLAGFSLRSAAVQRVFAILELLRAVAAFLVAPVLLHFAATLADRPTAAMGTALWICFALSVGGALAGVALYLLGGARPSAPSVPRWMDGEKPAWTSPPLMAAIRHGPLGRVPAERLAAALPDRDSARRLAVAPATRPPRHQARGDCPGPVLLGYDGSELAKAAIAEAGRQLPAGCDALLVTAWRTFNVEFVPGPRDALRRRMRRRGQTGGQADRGRRGLAGRGGRIPAQGIAVEELLPGRRSWMPATIAMRASSSSALVAVLGWAASWSAALPEPSRPARGAPC